MKAKATVLIKNDQKKIKMTPDLRRLVKRAVLAVLDFEDFGRRAEVSVTFTDNEGIHALNREYRNVDRPTDVLSFPLSDGEDYDTDGDAVLLGDIVISLERAQTQAEEYGHSFEREVAFLTVHSMLHLLGYDHEAEGLERVRMREKEEAVLTQLGLKRNDSYYSEDN